MAEVELITTEQAPLLVEGVFADGDPGPIAAALAQVPELCVPALPFLGAALAPGALGARIKELVVLRTSALLECRYCVAAHTVVALDVGLGIDEVRALRGTQPIDAVFTDARERALLAWIDAVAGARGAVPVAITRELKRHVEDHELVELAVAAGATMLLNRFCTALDLPTSPDTLARLAASGFDR